MKKVHSFTTRILWLYLSICVLSLLLNRVIKWTNSACLCSFNLKNDHRDNLKHAQCLYEWWILLLIYSKATPSVDIQLFGCLSFLLKITLKLVVYGFQQQLIMVLFLKTCFSLDYRSVSLKARKSDRRSLALKYLQTATLLRPVPS